MKATLPNFDIVAARKLPSSTVGWWDFTKGSLTTATNWNVPNQVSGGTAIDVTVTGAPTISGGYCNFGAIVEGIVLPIFTVDEAGGLIVAFGAKKISGEEVKVYGTGAGTVAFGVVPSGTYATVLQNATGNGVAASNGSAFSDNGSENCMAAFNNATFDATSVSTSYDGVLVNSTIAGGSVADVVLTSVLMDVRSISKLGIWNLTTPPSDPELYAAVQWMDAQWAAGNRVPYPRIAEWV